MTIDTTPTIKVILEKESDSLIFLLRHNDDRTPRAVIDAAAFYCPYVPLICSTSTHGVGQIVFKTRYDVE